MKALMVWRRLLRFAGLAKSEHPSDRADLSEALVKLNSIDGKRVLTVSRLSNGFFQFVEDSEQWEPASEYMEAFSYFAPTHLSGLYDSAEAAEADARFTLPWLRDQDPI